MTTNTNTTKRIEELESQRFYLSMKDHWTQADFERDARLAAEIRQLKTVEA